MIVTIFCDASYSASGAGWGAWVKTEIDRHTCGAPFKTRPFSSEDAELGSIINAVAFAAQIGLANPGDFLVIQNDCQGALGLLGCREFRGSRSLVAGSPKARLVERFHEVSRGFQYKFKWVKGHHPQRKTSPRHAVNHTVDRLAAYARQADEKGIQDVWFGSKKMELVV